MSRILVLGAGFVAGPLVSYLSEKRHQLTVASQFLEEAQAIADKFEEITICELDVSDENALGQLITAHDLTISFVPYQFHVIVAKQCIKYSKHMISASYETPDMKALHQQAVDKNITILNEIGLDPGIDHLSAMAVLDSIAEQGGKLESFVSWCGGLPSPKSNNNPLGYKFAWAPKGVLLALLNDATFIKEGKEVTVKGEQLLDSVQSIEINPELVLEGYPNRDSISYRDVYGLQSANTILRGTLRYPGFCAIFQSCKEMGLLATENNSNLNDAPTWQSFIESNVPDFQAYVSDLSSDVVKALEWLGLINGEQKIPKANTAIDAFCALLIEKLAYADDETDMVVLQHEFISVNAKGNRETRKSTLILEGDVDGYSAMAKTVGTPAAIAADLIVSGVIKETGTILPMTATIYEPMLKALANQGIVLEETFN